MSWPPKAWLVLHGRLAVCQLGNCASCALCNKLHAAQQTHGLQLSRSSANEGPRVQHLRRRYGAKLAGVCIFSQAMLGWPCLEIMQSMEIPCHAGPLKQLALAHDRHSILGLLCKALRSCLCEHESSNLAIKRHPVGDSNSTRGVPRLSYVLQTFQTEASRLLAFGPSNLLYIIKTYC